VARRASPSVIFNAAASALGGLIRADYTMVNRCEINRIMSVVTLWHAPGTTDVSPLRGTLAAQGRHRVSGGLADP
jgi:hypothetical protein